MPPNSPDEAWFCPTKSLLPTALVFSSSLSFKSYWPTIEDAKVVLAICGIEIFEFRVFYIGAPIYLTLAGSESDRGWDGAIIDSGVAAEFSDVFDLSQGLGADINYSYQINYTD